MKRHSAVVVMTDRAFSLPDDSEPEELNATDPAASDAEPDEPAPADLFDEGGVVTAGLPWRPRSRGWRTRCGSTSARSAASRS